ncbi:uncharacterized protein LOC142089475 [Calonectris borealis]|uniref:uncharacterized protein LOC142089475 n=1 Tax=Calonectris borealis TaxID=1323832 RepID=UPI003F4BEFC5
MLSIPPEEPSPPAATAACAEGRPGSAAALRRSPGSAHGALGRGQPHIVPSPRSPPPAGQGRGCRPPLAPLPQPCRGAGRAAARSVPRGGRRAPAGRGPLLHVGCSWPRLPPRARRAALPSRPPPRGRLPPRRPAASLARPAGTAPAAAPRRPARPCPPLPANGALGPPPPRAFLAPRAAPGRERASAPAAPLSPRRGARPPPPRLPRGPAGLVPSPLPAGWCRAAAGSSVPWRGPARPPARRRVSLSQMAACKALDSSGPSYPAASPFSSEDNTVRRAAWTRRLRYSLKLLLTSQKCGQGSRGDYHLPNLSQTATQPATHLLPLNEHGLH